jgi:hypothetical protein
VAIGEQARLKTPYFNTGCNSDELRGKNCNRFHSSSIWRP